MLDVTVLVQDVQTVLQRKDPHAAVLITLLVSEHLSEIPAEDIASEFNNHHIDARVGQYHLFLSIEGSRLRIPLRPLLQGDKHELPIKKHHKTR